MLCDIAPIASQSINSTEERPALQFTTVLSLCGFNRCRSTTQQNPLLSQTVTPHFTLTANNQTCLSLDMGLEGITNASFTSSIPWFNGLFNYRLLTKCNKHVWFYWTISERTVCGNLVFELQCADIGLCGSHFHWCWLKFLCGKEPAF